MIDAMAQNLRPVPVVVAAILIGAVIGVASLAIAPEGRSALMRQANDIAVSTGLKRQREPQVGDAWGGCNDAREAGTSPIYRGEPGYRADMDGDGDGIACEPYR